MREIAKVTSVSGDTVRVSIEKACEQSCARCSRTEKGRAFLATNVSGSELRAGDDVEVYVSPQSAVAEGALLFILPLVLFASSYGIARAFLSLDDTSGFIAGICGIGAGFLFNFVRGRILKGGALPRVTRKIQGAR